MRSIFTKFKILSSTNENPTESHLQEWDYIVFLDFHQIVYFPVYKYFHHTGHVVIFDGLGCHSDGESGDDTGR